MDWNLEALGDARVMRSMSTTHANAHELKALITPSNVNGKPSMLQGQEGPNLSSNDRKSNPPSRTTSHNSLNVFVIRLTLAILIASTLLAAFGALSNYSKSRQVLSCAISCTVCFTAAMHYRGILSIRTGESSLFSIVLHTGNTAPLEPVSAEEAFLQDENVDLLRHGDWLITLPLLGIELCNLLNDSSVKNPPSPWLIAILLLLVVVFGAVYRFPFQEGRLVPQRDGSVSTTTRTLAILSWIVAGALFTWVVVDLLMAAAHVTTSSEVANHTTAVVGFVLVWILYPVVSIASLVVIVINNYADRQPIAAEWVVLKDVGYGVLDVVSKAGLALYITISTLSG